MTNKCGRTRQRTNNLRDELILGINSTSELATVYYYTRRSIRGGSQSTPPGDKALCIIAPKERHIAVIDIFNEKRKSCNHRCPDSVYFRTLLLIIYLSAIERLICRKEMILTGSNFFGFAENTTHDFQNTVLNSFSGIVFDICHKKSDVPSKQTVFTYYYVQHYASIRVKGQLGNYID